MDKLKIFKIRKRWLAHLDELTESNYHTERLIEIAGECVTQLETGNHFGGRMFRDLETLLRDNLSEHDRIGHLPNILYVQREAYRLALCGFIKLYFDNGTEALEAIKP